jgi:hypothetical protein
MFLIVHQFAPCDSFYIMSEHRLFERKVVFLYTRALFQAYRHPSP